ncbi:hypothetical protein AGLY_006548, partial [Aphis glycines]
MSRYRYNFTQSSYFIQRPSKQLYVQPNLQTKKTPKEKHEQIKIIYTSIFNCNLILIAASSEHKYRNTLDTLPASKSFPKKSIAVSSSLYLKGVASCTTPCTAADLPAIHSIIIAKHKQFKLFYEKTVNANYDKRFPLFVSPSTITHKSTRSSIRSMNWTYKTPSIWQQLSRFSCSHRLKNSTTMYCTEMSHITHSTYVFNQNCISPNNCL